MGGLPCWRKVLLNGRTQQLLQRMLIESELTDKLLAAKGYFESPELDEFASLDLEIQGFLEKKLEELQQRNTNYANQSN